MFYMLNHLSKQGSGYRLEMEVISRSSLEETARKGIGKDISTMDPHGRIVYNISPQGIVAIYSYRFAY